MDPVSPLGAAESAPRWVDRPRGAWQLCLGALALWFVLGQIGPGIVIGVLIVFRSGGKTSPEEIAAQTVPYVGYILAASALVAILLVLAIRVAGWLAPGPRGASRAWARWTWLAAAGVVCIVGQMAISWLMRNVGWKPPDDDIVLQAASSEGAAFFLFAIVITPLAEELLFRRVLFSTLSRAQGRLVAYAATSLLFALIHFNLAYVPLYAWIAISCAAAYEGTGSVWGAVLVHSVNNAFAFVSVSL